MTQTPKLKKNTSICWFPDKIRPTKSPRPKFPREKKMLLRFSVATLFRYIARFARGRIEDHSFNRFALNGIPKLHATLFFGIEKF